MTKLPITSERAKGWSDDSLLRAIAIAAIEQPSGDGVHADEAGARTKVAGAEAVLNFLLESTPDGVTANEQDAEKAVLKAEFAERFSHAIMTEVEGPNG